MLDIILQFFVLKVTGGALSHPINKLKNATRLQTLDADSVQRRRKLDSVWDYIPESPSPSLLRMYHKQYDFMDTSDFDLTNTWNIITDDTGDITRNEYGYADGFANFENTGIAIMQEHHSGIMLSETQWFDPVSKTNEPILWAEFSLRKNDDVAEDIDDAFFIGFCKQNDSVYDIDGTATEMPDNGFGFWSPENDDAVYFVVCEDTDDRYTAYPSGSDPQDLTGDLRDPSGSNWRYQLQVRPRYSVDNNGERLNTTMWATAYFNGEPIGTLNITDDMNENLYLTITSKSISGTSKINLFWLKYLTEKPYAHNI